jgi:Ca2+-transporting ATPase
VQEARAERAVAALERMSAPSAAVLRDGAQTRIAATQVVPGDVLVLAEGDLVAADGRLFVAESLLIRATGETLTIRLVRPSFDLPARIASSFFCAVRTDTPIASRASGALHPQGRITSRPTPRVGASS